MVMNEKGWRMGRGNVVAREGRLYYEVKIVKGIPAEGPPALKLTENGATIAQPHVRMGWARREAPLDAPVGFDGYSYAITDLRLETMHRSRAAKIFRPLPKGTKSKHAKARPPHGKPSPVEYVTDMDVREGDVIGLEIQLPSLSMHRKVVEGIYNPAVDIGDGFDAPPHSSGPKDPLNMEKPLDIIRDRIPVPYKGNFYFEQLDYVATKPMEIYSDRGPTPKITPSPNHDDAPLRSLPHSVIKVYKNGKEVGIAFENLMAFLPPSSAPSAPAGARLGFDDGTVGYFPAIASFVGGIAQVNFGPDFWCPPEEMINQSKDVDMTGSDAYSAIPEGRKLRAISERYKEQIVEDVVWDIIDEVDFFIQDGGWDYRGEVDPSISAVKATPTARGMAGGLDDGVGVEVGRRY
jgi:COMPASS component BRE2